MVELERAARREPARHLDRESVVPIIGLAAQAPHRLRSLSSNDRYLYGSPEMIGSWFRKKIDVDAPLSPEADKYLAEALGEFAAKQAILRDQWGIGSQENWGFDQSEGVLRLNFHDRSQVLADIQVLGTYSKSGRTLEWAWYNPNVYGPLKKDSAKVRKLGKDLNIAYLQAGRTPVAGEEALSYLCGIGLKVAEAQGVFRGTAGPVEVLLLLKNLRRA